MVDAVTVTSFRRLFPSQWAKGLKATASPCCTSSISGVVEGKLSGHLWVNVGQLFIWLRYHADGRERP